MLRQKPEEVLEIFSEALKILDQNTVSYMIEELQKDLKARDVALLEKDAKLQEIEAELQEKEAMIQEKEALIMALQKQLNDTFEKEL